MNARTTISALLATALLGPGCQLVDDEPLEVSRTGAALIGGTIDTEDIAAVGLTRGPTPFCTGTLVSPSVILTAAHCIDMAGADPQVTAFFGADTTREGLRIGVKLKSQHVMWSGNVPDNNDIGLLLLNVPVDPTLAIPMNRERAEDHIGQPYRHIGFGIFENGLPSDGQKRQGTVTIADVTSTAIISMDENITTCFGDSGGPGLIDIGGVEHIAGVHSFTSTADGGSTCLSGSGDTAVDRHVEEYLQPWIDDHDPACRKDWLCGRIGCTADPDCEPCGPDGTCTTDCPLPDPDCGGSAFGEICQTDAQCDAGVCVPYFPDTNFHFCTIECTPGAGDCPDDMSCRNIQPYGDVCFYEDDPPGIVGDDCENHTDCGSYICEQGACVTPCDLSIGQTCLIDFECRDSGDGVNFYCYELEEEGGGCCSAGGSSSDGSGIFILMALVFLSRRRRRQRA